MIRLGGIFIRIAPGLQVANMLIQFILAMIPVGILAIIKKLIDVLVSEPQSISRVPWLFLTMAGLYMLQSLVSNGSSYLAWRLQHLTVDYLSLEILNKTSRIPYLFFEMPSHHDALHMAQRQAIYKIPGILTQVTTFMAASFSIITYLVYFTAQVGPITFLFVLISLPLAIQKWYSGKLAYLVDKEVIPLEREAQNYNQILTHPETVKEARIFRFEVPFVQRFSKIREQIFSRKDGIHRKIALVGTGAELFEALSMVFILFFLTRQALAEALSISILVIVIQGLQQLKGVLRRFFIAFSQILNYQRFIDDLFAFLDTEEKPPPSTTLPKDPSGGIQVKGVSFTYPETAHPVLKDINMNLHRGQIIAIVGPNGSGKSTLIKLLAHLYPPDEGTIIGHTSLRKRFIFQDFGKYFLTIADNISLGAAAKKEDLLKAVEASGADRLLHKLPNGFDTRLGRIFKKGVQLSGGEWQKIALSRAFYDDADLIVLDEPSSALDAEAENQVFRHLKAIADHRIIILITHRLYNLKIADHIYVMQEGKIVQDGTFSALRNHGLFKSLYDQQKL